MGGSTNYTVLLLLEWLYHQTTTVRTLSDDYIQHQNAVDAFFAADCDQVALCQLWVLAGILSIPDLQNSALIRLHHLIIRNGWDIHWINGFTKIAADQATFAPIFSLWFI